MAHILVFAEVQQKNIRRVALEILGKLDGHSVDVVSIKAIPQCSVDDLKRYGAKRIFVLDSAELDSYSSEGYAQALGALIKKESYEFVFAGSTPMTKDFMPRLAGSFDAGMATEITSFIFAGEQFSATRPLFAGKVLADLQFEGAGPHFVTVRPNALGISKNPTAGTGFLHKLTLSDLLIRAKVSEIIQGVSEQMDLTEADIIVSGGRAMKNADNFKMLYELAKVLGGSVGASRVAVDSGYAPPSLQVGQTGKTVSPKLYIACGISGSIQHFAGMRTAKVLVAINTDPNAPMVAKADYAIIGDLFQVVPMMTEAFRKIMFPEHCV